MSTATKTKPSIVRMPGEELDSSVATAPEVDSDIQIGVGRAKKEGPTTDDFPLEQPSDIVFPINDPFVRPTHEIKKSLEQIQKEYNDDLAFAEEPVGIYILPSQLEHGSPVAECWIDGKGAEIWDPMVGRWLATGIIPRGQNVVTKRKYVEVLMRSLTDGKVTEVIETPGQDPKNFLRTRHVHNFPIQITRDDNKVRGRQWFRDLSQHSL
jgi:hypothetical protein